MFVTFLGEREPFFLDFLVASESPKRAVRFCCLRGNRLLFELRTWEGIVFYLNCAHEFLFCGYALKLLEPNTAFWLVRALELAHDVHIKAPIRGRAESARQVTVSIHPNRRRFPLKQQNLTALFGKKIFCPKSFWVKVSLVPKMFWSTKMKAPKTWVQKFRSKSDQ